MLSLGSLPGRHIRAFDVSRVPRVATHSYTIRHTTDQLERADNHKPELSSETAPSTARITQASQEGSFSLGFEDKGDQYTYSGVRTTKDGNYVLIFDPSREVFVLHRLDSLFHMNLTSTPDNSDVDSLRKQFPQLEVQPTTSGKTAGPAKKVPTKNTKTSSALRKSTTKKQSQQQKKTVSTATMPPPPAPPSTTTTPSDRSKVAAPSSAKKNEPKPTLPAAPSKQKPGKSPEPDEDDDDDDDDGLILEFPGGPPPQRIGGPRFVPPPTVNRRFSELLNDGEDNDQDMQHDGQPAGRNDPAAGGAGDDADGEDEDDEMDLTFTSTFPSEEQEQQPQQYEEIETAPTPTVDDVDFDDLEAAFAKADGSDSESEVSEAD